jgi:hypothetical protein
MDEVVLTTNKRRRNSEVGEDPQAHELARKKQGTAAEGDENASS